MQSGRWALVVVGALLACGDNRDAPRDGGVGSDDADEVVADGAVDAPPDGAPDAPPDAPADAGIDAAPRCGDGHPDPGEECDEGIEGLSGDGCSSTCTTEEMSWTNLTPNLAPKVGGAAMAYDSSRNRIVVFGGAMAGDPILESDQTWEWDGTSWTRRLTLVSPPARWMHAMVYDSARQRIVIFGGMGANGGLNDTWEWDGTTWTQVSTAISPPGGSWPYMAYDPTRQVTVLWDFAATWEYDGTTWTKKTSATVPVPASSTALVYSGAAGIMLIGGTKNFFWDGSDWTQVSFSAQVPWDSSAVAAVYDNIEDRVLAVSSPVDIRFGMSVWEWTNGDWLQIQSTIPGGPTPTLPSIAFDSTRGVITLLGGAETPALAGQTWDWDGSRWSEHYGSVPPPRDRAQVAYDSRRARVVMFGGAGRVPLRSDTWEWDGTDWTARTSAETPEARFGANVAYDEGRGVVVIYGGEGGGVDGSGNTIDVRFTDTWEWDGTSWQQRFPSHNPGETGWGNVMAYDRAQGYMLLFHAGETWKWNGVDWVPLTTAHAPAGALGLVHDARRGVSVLYTPDNGAEPASGEVWEWNGVDWIDRGPAPVGDQILYDPLRGRTVLFHWDWFGDTTSFWTWDGTSWSGQTSAPREAAGLTRVFDPTTRSWFSFGEPGGWDTWLARSGANDPHEQCDGSDVDGDGLTRCADPDCWWRCMPLCATGDAYCDPNAPRCGDGTCSSIEDSALCPADCP